MECEQVFCPATKQFYNKPCGSFCRTGGTTMECYPLMGKADILRKLEEKGEFAMDFALVRKGCTAS